MRVSWWRCVASGRLMYSGTIFITDCHGDITSEFSTTHVHITPYMTVTSGIQYCGNITS